jgi:hypothetical protein
VRATAGGRGQRLARGVALYVRGREAWLAELRAGSAQPIGKAVRIRRRWHRRGLEIAVLLLGKHLVAHLYDASDRAQLAVLATDRLPAGDGVGLVASPPARGAREEAPKARRARSGASNDGGATLTALAARPACARATSADEGGPFVVAIVRDERKKVAASPGLRPLERIAGDPPRLALRANRAGLEALACSGRELLEIRTIFPWKHLDVGYADQRGKPPLRTPSGFRIDQGAKSPEMVEALLRGWHARYPALTRLVRLGQSHQGRPLLALAIGPPGDAAQRRPAVLLDGAHHGDEPLSVELVLDAIQLLLERASDPRVRRWLAELAIWCVPVVNPDGLAAFLEVSRATGRKNGRGLAGSEPQSTERGVDINRNYPFRWGTRAAGRRPDHQHYRGPAAASEPETRAMIELARRERFVAAVSFHSGTVAVLAPYTIDGARSPLPNEAWTVAEEIVARLAPHPHGKPFRVLRRLYSVDGTDQDWHRHAHGTLAYILESGRHSPIDPVERNRVVAAVRPFWQLLWDRLLDGPALSGRVLDAGGQPLEVELRLREQRALEGERWTTRPRDGRFDRYLARAGRYRLELVRCGSVVATRVVQVGRERAQLEIRLPGTARCPASRPATQPAAATGA